MMEWLTNPTVFITIALWSLVWKALVLWRSARQGQTAWFFILLVVNTLGVLEIIYLLLFSRQGGERMVDVLPNTLRSFLAARTTWERDESPPQL